MKAASILGAAFGACLLSFSVSALADNALTSRPANVLAGPDDSYPVVAQLDADTPIQVMGCLDDWSYCDVAFEGNRGWLYSPDITYEYNGGYVPLYSYAPALGIAVVPFSVDAYWGRYYHDRPWYGQREEFMRRGPPHHERPSGPPPSHSPPPREALLQRPAHQGGPIRLSSSDSAHQDSERHGGSADHPNARAPAPRPDEHAAPYRNGSRAGDNRADNQSRPTEHAAPQREDRHPASSAPSNREEHATKEPSKREPQKEERKDHPDHPDSGH